MARDIILTILSSVVRAKDIVHIGICGDSSHNKAYLYTHCQINEYNIALAKQFFL